MAVLRNRQQSIVKLDRKRPATVTTRTAAVADVFCGVWGLSHGFYLEGFDVRVGIDIDSGCRFGFEQNNDARFLQRDVGEFASEVIQDLFRWASIQILVGCAPCQPFSSYNKSDRQHKWRTLKDFERIVAQIRPEIVSMGNVPGLVRFNNGELFNSLVTTLGKIGYDVWWGIVNAADYGVPQMRRRLVLLASLIGEIELEEPSHDVDTYVTVRDAIGSLPKIEAGEQHRCDTLHRASRMSATNMTRIKASQPGGTWMDWDPELRAPCHRDTSRETYRNVYGRMRWDSIAPTITTQFTGFGNGRFGHPEQHRARSLREAALLQSFPDTYQFHPIDEEPSIKAISRWIGNAVPVSLARAIARSVARTV